MTRTQTASGYRYGLYLNPRDTDPRLSDESEARQRAQEMSHHNNGTPVAVWDDAGQVVALYAGYEEFKPVTA